MQRSSWRRKPTTSSTTARHGLVQRRILAGFPGEPGWPESASRRECSVAATTRVMVAVMRTFAQTAKLAGPRHSGRSRATEDPSAASANCKPARGKHEFARRAPDAGSTKQSRSSRRGCSSPASIASRICSASGQTSRRAKHTSGSAVQFDARFFAILCRSTPLKNPGLAGQKAHNPE